MPVYLKEKKKDYGADGDGLSDVASAVAPILLKLLGNALDKPASQLGEIITDKIKKLTGRGPSKTELNKLIGIIKEHQKGMGVVEGEGLRIAGNNDMLDGRGVRVAGDNSSLDGGRAIHTEETVGVGPFIVPKKKVGKKK